MAGVVSAPALMARSISPFGTRAPTYLFLMDLNIISFLRIYGDPVSDKPPHVADPPLAQSCKAEGPLLEVLASPVP